MTHWHVQQGDIFDVPADGLLCSANPHLNLSGGVGGEFLLRYGGEMQRFLHRHLADSGSAYLRPGNCVVAPPCGSPYAAVAHAVAVDGFYETNATTILTCYDVALRGLAETGCRTIAGACLGCGYGRFPADEFAALTKELFARCYNGVNDIWLVTTNATLADGLRPILAT